MLVNHWLQHLKLNKNKVSTILRLAEETSKESTLEKHFNA